ANLDRMKADPRFQNCPPAQKRIACQEVNLMWAGHNAWARAFETAQKKVAGVEGQMALTQADLNACRVPAKPVPPPVQAAPQVLPPVINLGADALFKFDKSGAADMLPEGRAKLDVLAETLQKVKTVKALSIVGHTDRLGTEAYNAALSQRRADTVMAYLKARGVTPPMRAQGVGSGSPLVQCPGPASNAVKACLQPNRRVEIRVEQ
ncbi:OmpA family protein, partial [Uliginosibacterium sp. sgz301328]|uniref:OmpA family protein n=1 Tax=Uliginosibacterium sp. sgz301328 TaxID=3243764 RepID=UPI00359CF382